MTDHIAVALDHLLAVEATRHHLTGLYEKSKRGMHGEERNNLGAQIAEAHQSIGYGLKAAAIHAQIAQAVELREARPKSAGQDSAGAQSCPACSRSFRNKAALDKHVNAEHVDQAVTL